MIFRSFRRPPLIMLAFLTACMFIINPGKSTAQVLDRIVAIVNDDIITLSEFESEGEEFLQRVRQSASAENYDQEMQQAREQVLSKLINQQLITQEAKKAGVNLSDQEFENAFAANLRSMNMSRDEFLRRLKSSGLSEEQYREDLRSKLLRDKLVLYEVRSKIVVTEEMIADYYNNEYAGEIAEGGYYLLQMGFTWSDDGSQAEKLEARKRAEEARQVVTNGADFATVARQKSELPSAADGGDIGVFQANEMAESMRQAVVPMKAGEVSEIIETSIGYQFFKLLSTQKGDIVQQVPYDNVKEEIRKKLYEKKFNQEYVDWVENIKKGSYIKRMLY